MFASRPALRLPAWFALWALVLGALMPLAAQAFARVADTPDAVEICTSTGVMRLQAQPADGDDGFSLGQHCPLCTLHGVAGLPPSSAAAFEPVRFAAMPPLFLCAPRTAAVWRSAQPRAPPFLA